MMACAGPLHLLALVLIVSGLGKMVQPSPAVTAMRDAGLPGARLGPAAGIGLGVVEVSVGATALAVPTWWAATALGGFYLALAAFVLRLRATDADAGCGCFGASSTPPGTAHLVLNVAAAATAFAAAGLGVPDIVEVFDDGLAIGVPYVFLLAVGAGVLLIAPGLTSEIARLRSGELPPAFAPVRAGRTS